MPIIIKFQKAKDQFFKSVKYPEKNYARYMGEAISMIAHFSSETMETRMKWNNICKLPDCK